MANFDEDILRITNECLTDGTVDEIIRKKVVAGFESAIDDAFKWGDLSTAIKTRVKEILVPYIENYDMSEYIVKLDAILKDIIAATSLSDNKELLENFKNLMIEPEIKEITVSQLFDSYNQFVAENMSTTGRDINYETGGDPEYMPMDTNVAFTKDDERHWSSFEYGILDFTVEEEDQEEDLNKSVRLSRWKDDKKEGWSISYNMPSDIASLRGLNEFDILLMRLERANVKVIMDTTSDSDEVTPVAEPEPTYE